MDGRPCGRLFRAMTRCECAEQPFDQIVRELRGGRTLDEVQADTGAGLLCTACLPDLREHLEAAGVETVPASDVRSCVPEAGEPEDASLAAAADPR